MANEKPRYTHDCELCVFLGRFTSAWEENRVHQYDLYWCAQDWGGERKPLPTLIARFSSRGPDYFSGGAWSSDPTYPVVEARKRAQAKGLDVGKSPQEEEEEFLRSLPPIEE